MKAISRRALTAICAVPAATVASWSLVHAAPLQPLEIESLIARYLGNVPGLTLSTLRHVRCDTKQCEIAFTGTDANPQYVDAYSDLSTSLWRQGFADGLHMLTGSLGTREISPGVREYVHTFTYALVDAPSDEGAESVARQHAACARAWRARAERAETMDRDVIAAEARQQAGRYLELAASVLPRPEAERLARLPDEGALIEACIIARTWFR